MDKRKNSLIYTIITEYIKDPHPVSSQSLVDKFALSSATIRNEMADLEAEGYIFQPHTSAGRVPTEKGYLFYVENYLEDENLSAEIKKRISQALKSTKEEKIALKNLAKELADISGEAVILAFSKNDIYYTGVSNLFAKPEFADRNLVCRLSQVIDHLEKAILDLFDSIKETEIKVGSQCPFGNACSAVIGSYDYQGQRKERAILAILGPSRMNYNKNFSLINFIVNTNKY